jgi:hypothetical protein
MRALVRLLGLMRREGNVSGKAVKRAIDAVRRGGVGVRVLRECGTVPGTLRFFEFEDEQGRRRMATEQWLREKGVDPDAELALVSGDNSVHAGRDVRRGGPKPVRSRRRRRQADGEGPTLF